MESFSTKDMQLAAYLRMEGRPMIGIRRERFKGRDAVFFVFEDRSECEGMAMEFLNSDFFRFAQELKSIKNIMFDHEF